ncbi:MAG: hypothetical protein RLZZ385_2576 [Pseudomonadota bacterium]|jgi:Fe-S cluster biosynthesis and repair protein YggX
MTRMVQCKKYGKSLPGLPVPPYPGPRGQEIYDTVSQQAWKEWQQQQTMLINEKHLNMADPAHRQYLQQEMDKFLRNESHDQAEGFTPKAG